MRLLEHLLSYDAIFFDLDGVLIDSVAIKDAAFAALYADHGPEIVEWIGASQAEQPGVSRFDKIRAWERELRGAPVDESIVRETAEHFSALVVERVVACPEIPGAGRLLRALHGRRPLFVVTATPQVEASRILERRGTGHLFERICGFPDRKPQILHGLLEEYDLPRSRTVMVGDTTADFEASRSAGTAFLGVGAVDDHPFPPATRVVADLS